MKIERFELRTQPQVAVVDRLTGRNAVQVTPEYASLVCLERKPEDGFTGLVG